MWDEYLYGSEILVAPVYKNGDRSRSVYLPEGNWLDYNNKSTIYPGPKTITADAPLATIPLFIKEGAIIPKGDIVKANNSWDNSWSPELNIEVYPAINETSTFDYYTGNEVVQITCLRSGDNITVSFDDLGINGNIKIYADGYNTVSRNGESLNPGSEFTYDSSQKMFSIPFNGSTTINISGTASLFG